MKFIRSSSFLFLVAMVAVVAVDVAIGPDAEVLTLLAIGPLLVIRGGCQAPGKVVGFGLAALVTCLAAAAWEGYALSRISMVSYAAIILITAATAIASLAHRRSRERISEIGEVAEATQRVILRNLEPRQGQFDTACAYISATQAARVGGDFYDVVQVPGGIRVIMGDVEGKGLSAIRASLAALSAFRFAAATERSIDMVARRVECALTLEEEDRRFATALILEIDESGMLRILNFGHHSPVVLRQSGDHEVAAPDEAGLPLGLGIGAAEPGRTSLVLNEGDRVLLYTDGLCEARSTDGDFYPVQERLSLLGESTEELKPAALHADAEDFTKGVMSDDSALMLIRYRPEGSRAAVPPEEDRPESEDMPAACVGCRILAECPLT
ncbi:PP2C family protein-serine/threonine phosphatase [Streptomyces sp. NPDC014891]|uniref:PP2C family protein-serine/threonine phosphatase n=1 Tax=Streptomyces sp. NPDC014891 TaxID=3364929 RepID=UPI00370322C5